MNVEALRVRASRIKFKSSNQKKNLLSEGLSENKENMKISDERKK